MRREKPKTDTNGRGSPAEKSVLAAAVDVTLRTFEARSRVYRNLVVAVSLVGATSILSAVILWTAIPLLGVALVVALTAGFARHDAYRVSRWRTEILEMYRTRGLDLAAFYSTLSKFKHLPEGSLGAMLATLPRDSPDSAH